MKKFILITIVFFTTLCIKNVYTQTKKAFEIFNKKGKKVNYKKLINEAKSADIILFGEYHDNPISHWLEFELAKDLLSKYEVKIITFEYQKQSSMQAAFKAFALLEKLDYV